MVDQMQLRKGKTLPERQPPVAKDKGKEKRIEIEEDAISRLFGMAPLEGRICLKDRTTYITHSMFVHPPISSCWNDVTYGRPVTG